MIKNIIYPWLLVIRIKTLSAAISPVIIGTSIAFKDSYFNISIFIVTIIAACLIQIGTNISNDIFDFLKGSDTKDRLGPIRAAQTGILSIVQLKRATIIVFFIAILFGIYLVYIGGYPIIIIGLSSILCGLLYTGGRYPLGYNGMGDIFVFIFFGLIAVSGTYYLQTGNISIESMMFGIAIGCLTTAILVVNNIRDVMTDEKSGKNTLAVIFGLTFSKIEFTLLLILPYIILLYIYYYTLFKLSIWLPFFSLPLSIHLIIEIYNKSGSDLNHVLFRTSKLLLIYSLLLSLAIII